MLSEVRALVAEGVKEINLISQDTTYYGMDLVGGESGPRQPVDSARGPTLAALLREIQKDRRANFGCACSTRIRRIGARN